MRMIMIQPRRPRSWWRRVRVRVLLACGLSGIVVAPAWAQLDPLLFVKRMPPNVVIVLDTSRRMLEDVNGYYYDPNFYRVVDDPAVATALNVPAGAVTYRRKYLGLQWTATQDANNRFTARDIVAVPAVFDPAVPSTANAPADLAYLDPTRLGIAKRGILQAVSENGGATYRWGFIKTRQSSPAWRMSPVCDKPVEITGNATLQNLTDTNPCAVSSLGKFAIYDPSVAAPNYSLTTVTPALIPTAANTAATVTTLLNRGLFDANALIPAGIGSSTFDDRPLTFQLIDAAKEASDVMTRDTASTRACRNTIVVLITSGKNAGSDAYMSTYNAATQASNFRTITGGGVTKRVPVYVIGIGVPATEEDELRAVASNSGGRYFNVTDQPSVTRAINLAVQAGFSRTTDFNSSTASEFTGVSPVVGTVNSKGLKDITGTKVSNDDITRPADGTAIPQRSNVMITAGFAVPGMDARIRAFRAYKPVADSTKAIGYRFEADGTRLWPDLDGRPALAGLARTPADPNQRNIYTALPDGGGGVNMIAFTTGNAATIAPHLALPSGYTASSVIGSIRSLPIGAVISSTPALMDPPSLDPPPDVDYGRADGSDTFAGRHMNRRSIIFVGANDGMIHAIDARTGYEVWAFIPYNMLPKLKTLIDGQPIEQFDFFVDSSPKIAEVKTHRGPSHEWRSLLIVGEGAGGTFYQTFDVTEAGMGVAPDDDDLSAVNNLLQQFDQPNESIEFLWSFPNYSSFDPTIAATFNVTDSTPGGKVKIYGDLKSSATFAEKTVGLTWSDPAVGPLDMNRTTNVVMVGSGY
ncbi:MAG: VWA domain-containing protein, partial [Acidobacteriota bacterium]